MSAIEVDTAYVRAFTECPGKLPLGALDPDTSPPEPSDRVLIFDCETTDDPVQALRFGFFQLREAGVKLEEGIFYDPETIDRDERALLEEFAIKHALKIETVEDFRRVRILNWAYDGNATIVGFNLPFDISRIAIDAGPARYDGQGGFSFLISKDRRRPRVRVKHLNASACIMSFAAPWKGETPRSMWKRGEQLPTNYGFFIDVKTQAAALLSRRFTLAKLTVELDTPTKKEEREDYGGPLTEDYIRYARDDVQATWECFEQLMGIYAEHGLRKPAHKILSEASIGKSYLEEMGILPFFRFYQNGDRGLLGQIMSTYFGGRAEVRLRKLVAQVLYCDFKSMYPTVNALLGLSKFLTAQGIKVERSTADTQQLLNETELSDLQNPHFWSELTTIARLKPDSDVLPLRSRYSPEQDQLVLNIGLNVVSSELSLWYTLPDLIAAKLLSGKPPVIEEALTFRPGRQQAGLRPVKLFGDDDFVVDPEQQDIFTRLIDLRDTIPKNDPRNQATKIVANSTGYGIFAEVQRDDAAEKGVLSVYGPDGQRAEILTNAVEQPGKYFHPVLATLITGSARLMLAIAERLGQDEGLDWVFCDTDSIAYAKPGEMFEAEFESRTLKIIDWFLPLNPYARRGSILKIEDENYQVGDGKQPLRPLYCYAISAKRYVLFNLDQEGQPIIRKLSAHGLGHLRAPYEDDDPARDVPDPVIPLDEMGVRRWQYDFWFHILLAAIDGHPNQVALNYHPALQKPAMLRYGATSPKMLSWMNPYNQRQNGYRRKVKPFGFMSSFMGRSGAFAGEPDMESVDPSQRGRPRKPTCLRPIAPFDRDPDIAAAQAFDRVSGEPIDRSQLLTYAEALALYHVSPENKFANGGPADIGRTERRCVHIKRVRLIGKETNRVGETGQGDPISPAVIVFGEEDQEPRNCPSSASRFAAP